MSDNYVIPKKVSWQMFNEISPRYDILNHVLSFGLDIHWRRSLGKFLPKKSNLAILDVATGTADVLLSIFKNNPNAENALGVDMAEKMLQIGEKKIAGAGLNNKIKLIKADAAKIPAPDAQFDAATIAFGIRNMQVPTDVLKEMARCLKPGGVTLVLEFSLPANTILKFLHLFYLRNVVPAVGFLISGHYKAYRYLNQTIEDFPYGEKFCALIKSCGYAKVNAHRLLGGVATIYEAIK